LERITLTAKEASQYLGISYWLILELAKQKRIPHIRAGKRVLFRKLSLEEWLESEEKNSTMTSYNILNKGIRKINP
jgi:excisionase family DNA binding protein